MSEALLYGLISIVVFGVGAQWLAWRFKLPAILLLLLAGLIAGPITNLLNPDLLLGDVLPPFISVSVGIILFEGGLSLRFSELRDIRSSVINLVSTGVIVTMVIGAYSAHQLFNMSLELAVLMGAILVVTGPTVIIPLLRQVRPAGQVGSILKWEGIVIDPIGAMLAVLVFEVIFASGFSEATSIAVTSIIKTIFFGTILGLAGAGLIYLLLKRYLLPDFLQNPVTFMVVLAVFGLSNFLQHESGLWATTVMGIALANQKSARIHHIVEFKENLRVLLLSALFILLAARVELESLLRNLNWEILLFLIILIFIARPLSVYLSTIGSNLTNREKLFLSWMAPRGVVAASISSLFAIQLVNNNYSEAEQLVPIIFIVIIATVTIYGLTASPVARWLKVAKPTPRGLLILGAHPWARKLGSMLDEQGFKVVIADANWSNINKVRKLGLESYHGNVLAEYALDEIDLDGIGKLLALTPNDEVNALASIRFSDIFGTSEVYQLASNSQLKKTEREEVPDTLSGRTLFNENLNYETMTRLLSEGAFLDIHEIKKDYSQKDFDERYNERLIPLFLLKQNQEVIPYSTDNKPIPEAGDKIFVLTHMTSSRRSTPEESRIEESAT